MLKMQLSIIIVSYKTLEITRACLQSIKDSNIKLNYEIILVDNASNDGTKEMVSNEFSNVVLISNKINNMFAKANNQGLALSKGDYLLLLNSDTIIEPNNIEKIYNFIDSHQPEVGCVGPRVINLDRSFQAEAYNFESMRSVFCVGLGVIFWPIPFKLKEIILPKGFPRFNKGVLREVDWVPGCSFLISRNVYNTIGGLDEDFLFYHEEVEYCYRMKKKGFTVWCQPKAEIIHIGGASTNSDILRVLSEDQLLNRKLFYEKTIGISRAKYINFTAAILYRLSFLFANLIGLKEASSLLNRYYYMAKVRYKYLSNK